MLCTTSNWSDTLWILVGIAFLPVDLQFNQLKCNTCKHPMKTYAALNQLVSNVPLWPSLFTILFWWLHHIIGSFSVCDPPKLKVSSQKYYCLTSSLPFCIHEFVSSSSILPPHWSHELCRKGKIICERQWKACRYFYKFNHYLFIISSM